MVEKKNKAAVSLGRKGGKKTSTRKAASSAANGRKGGRPRTRREQLMQELLKTVPLATAMEVWLLFDRRFRLNLGDFNITLQSMKDKVE